MSAMDPFGSLVIDSEDTLPPPPTEAPIDIITFQEGFSNFADSLSSDPILSSQGTSVWNPYIDFRPTNDDHTPIWSNTQTLGEETPRNTENFHEAVYNIDNMELLNRATQSMVYGTDMQSTKISNDLLKTSEPLDYDLSPIIDWNKKLDELQFPTSVEKSANEGDLSCKTNLSDKKDQAESAAEQGNIDQLAQTTIFEEQVPNMESIAAIQTYEATSTPMKNKRQGKLGANRKTLKGEVRHLPNGTLEWRSQYEWKPAVHHYEIRQDLIAEMNAQGTYDHPRWRGLHHLDVTCFHPDQKNWGPDRRRDWPNMKDKLLFMLERRDHRDPDYKVDLWYHEGRIVLDHDNHPMRDFRDIPKTLASNVEDYIVEAILRTDQRITQVDIRARMPGEKVNIKGEVKEIGTLSMLNMRLKRFRWANALPPWCQRDCTENFNVYVKWKLSRTGSRQGIKNNSVEELESLTLLEQAEVEAMSKGKFGARAGKRALDAKVRVTRDESLEKRIRRLENREGRKFRVLDLEKMKKEILLNTEPAPALPQAIDHHTPRPQEPIFSEPAQSQFPYQTHQLQESAFPPANIWQPQNQSSNQICAPWVSSEGPPAGKRSHADFLENHVSDPYEPRKQRKIQEISPFEADFSGASTYTNGLNPQYINPYSHPVPPQNHQAPAYRKEIMGGHPGMTFPTIPTCPGHSCHQPSNSNNLFTGLYDYSMNPSLEQPLSCYPPSYQQQLTLPRSSGQITTPAILPLPGGFITPPLTLSAFSSPNQTATLSNDQTRPGHSYTPVTPESPKIQQWNPNPPQTLRHRFIQPGDLEVNTFSPTIIEEEDLHRISPNYSENKPLRHEELQPLAALSTNLDGMISGISDHEFTEMCKSFWTPGYSWMEDMNAKM